MSASSKVAVWLATAGLTLLCGATGCANQGEGEWCSSLNNNDDCNAGLACVSVNRTQLCCPVAPAKPSVPQCIEETMVTTPTADAAVEASEETDAQSAPDAENTEPVATDAVAPEPSALDGGADLPAVDAAPSNGDAATTAEGSVDGGLLADVSVEASPDASGTSGRDAAADGATGG